jgi:serine/threonine protein kinase
MEPLTADDPRQVSVFRLQSRLGAGGMGRVYLATSPGGRAVAVKVVHPELARDPEFMRRFRREVEAAEAVSGVYTAPVVGAGPDDSPPWLATAYVPGPSLSELVAAIGPLPEAAVWRLAGGLVEALQAIHGRGLVHRDLKPGNILIAADGPRVIDFGISRAMHGIALTATHTTMGTPAFMSPEQAESRDIGPASDVFSLGSVLAFAATGTAPFDGGDMMSVLYRIVHSEPDLSRLPPALGALVAGCLAKDPASRPSLTALLGTVTAAAESFPENAPGQFWPDLVARAITSASAWQAAPVSGAGLASQTGYVTPSSHPVTYYPAQQTDPAQQPGTMYPGHLAGTTAPPGQSPSTIPGGRSSRRWLLAIGGAAVAAAAIGATLAVVLAPGATTSTHTTAQAPPAHTATTQATATTPATSPSTSSPATSAPATTPAASPTNSLIAVTVCVFPADGCTQPGAAQYMEVKPKEIATSGDGSGSVTNLVWSDWGAPHATATGTMRLNDCTPNCAEGKYTSYPATVTLAGLTPYGTDLEAYSTIVVQSPAANTTETYTKDTVPTS